MSVITQTVDLYCLESLSPAFSHIWVMGFETISITVAMYCLIQFYIQIKDDIRQHSPLLKITAIKLVIFLSFWQTIAISLLTGAGAIKATKRIQTPDIKVGIPALLLCIEMAFFSIFHIWSFSWKSYTLGSSQQMSEVVAGENVGKGSYQGGFLGLKAIFDAFNVWDMLKATGRSARWLFKGRKTRHADASYSLNRKDTDQSDFSARGQNLSTFNNASGAAKLPPYNGGGDEEDANLLANSQHMSTSRPPNFQTEGHYDSNNASDIGLATSSYDDKFSRRNESPSRQRPTPPAYQSYRGAGGEQESGVVGLPYPDAHPGASWSSQNGGNSNNNRLSMPRPRSPESSLRRGPDGKQGNGNFF